MVAKTVGTTSHATSCRPFFSWPLLPFWFFVIVPVIFSGYPLGREEGTPLRTSWTWNDVLLVTTYIICSGENGPES